MTDQVARPRFYEGQYLSADDLTAAVDYGRTQLARAMLATHRWGIALGLDLTETAGPNNTVTVSIEPGWALDGFGRPLLVSEPVQLTGSMFAAFDAGFVPANPPPPPIVVDVWLAYDEALADPPLPGFQTCDTSDSFGRVQESFRIEVGPRTTLASQRDPVAIAGVSTDAAQALRAFDSAAPPVIDADIPQQSLPVATTARWLVPLGVVAWQPGAPGSFTKRDAAALTRHARSRTYVGTIARSIEAESGHVTVHDRSKDYSADHTDELLWVEGQLRTDDDIHVYRGSVGLISDHAEDPVLPIEFARTDDPGTGHTDLNLVIGDKSAGANRLVVGPRTAPNTYTENLVVTDDGKVGVDVGSPKAPLHVTADGIQLGDSTTPTDNFYLQSNNDGGRGLRIYNKDIGAGAHVATFTPAGQVGIGTTAPTAPLHVDPVLGIRQGNLYLSGDKRWSSLTFNAHHDAANGTWVFPDSGAPAVTAEMDAADGGHPRFEVFATAPGNNTSWISRLKVAGHSGDVLMGLAGGNLGVGTGSPAARLDVSGDVAVSGNVRLGTLLAAGAEQAVRVLWGVVESGGGIRAGTGYAVTRSAAGRYRITYTNAFTGTPLLLVSRVYGDSTVDAGGGVNAAQTAVVDQTLADHGVVATANENGVITDGGFTFVAIGPR
ncbi:hypothetical protein [Flexivirga oryzae]|uniref:Uncharacterized protein n=1 Tax=Flexivirga oryzae TaxID=1794944 RepID=A0A839N4S9_9MICO|nr:hypothetical protein [Flexivirga oryzae]MBB2890225.1 hypothetical protein [Flexivirga oryzae]